MKRSFRKWPKSLRVLSIVGVSLLVLVGIGVGAGFAYSTLVAPQVQAAIAEQCEQSYTTEDAQEVCRGGDKDRAARVEAQILAKEAKKDECVAQYDDQSAQNACMEGNAAAAGRLQTEADKAAAEAERIANIGTTFDNPFPAGTKVPMVSTNRLDGTETTYTEWVSDFNADWRGYDKYDAPDPGMKYVSFIVNVEANDAGVDAGSTAYDASFTDTNGNVYGQASATYDATPQMPDVSLGDGQQAQGIVVFQVPQGVTGGVATFGNGTVFVALG